MLEGKKDYSYEDLEALLSKAQSGDQAAMGDLILALDPLIKKQIRYYFGRPDEDLLQMGRLRALELIRRFDPGFTDVKFLGYMARFLGAYFWDVKKQHLRDQERVNGYVDMEELAERATYEEEGFLQVDLEDILGRLLPQERCVIEANVLEGLSLSQLAKDMDLTRDQVRYLKKKGLDALRRLI